MPAQSESFQSYFHRRWNHLHDPHVRALAWLLDAPDLLDPQDPVWQGRIATIGTPDERTCDWLAALDHAPQPLHAHLDLQPFTRLGRYAEKLMAFYFRYIGTLHAHGVQVRTEKGETIGEFDFLLRQGEGLVHWEFATKLYLLESSGRGQQSDYFVGPNLADTLGAKIRKIMDRQLSLSRHPAAGTCLSLPIVSAQALVKGWLFYHGAAPQPVQPQGVAHGHCRGFWCTLGELAENSDARYAVLPRLAWLAPVRMRIEETVDAATLGKMLAAEFRKSSMPALVSVLDGEGDVLLEQDRGFIVPDDWQSRAGVRLGLR